MFQSLDPIKSAAVTSSNVSQSGFGFVTGVDLGKIIAILLRNKMLIAGAVILSVLAVFAFATVVTPQFTARTQILIDPSDLRGVNSGVMPNANQTLDSNAVIESQVHVITSDNVLRRVIDKLRLAEDSEFANSQNSVVSRLLTALLAPFGLERDVPGRFDPTLAALNDLRRLIKVRRSERTYVVDVSVTTKDGEKSVRVADAIAEAYLAEQNAARSEASRRVSNSLTARLGEQKDRLRQAEERAERFKAQNNIVGAGGQLVNEQQLSELNIQLGNARARSAEAKSKLEQVQALRKSGAEAGALPEAVQSQTITALRTQYGEIVRREAELTSKLGARHPSVIEIRAQVEEGRRLIREEINRIAQAAAGEYERAHASEESLGRSVEALKRNAMTTSEAMVQLRELEREVQASRAVYESFLVRARETGEQERVDTNNVRVISAADLPLRRSWPPRNLLLAFGATIFGLAAGVGLAFLREIMGLGVLSVRPSLVVTDLPLLAVFPLGAELQPLAAFGSPTSRVATETRKLQNALYAIQQTNFGRAVLFVAQNNNDDVTPLVLNLAALAASEQNVLLIDADIRRPTLSALFPDQNRLGFVDVAAGGARLRDAMVCDTRTGINYLPLFAANNRKHRTISRQDIKSAFDQTEPFDLVIVAATIRENDLSAILFAELVDHIVLVVKAEEARKPDLAGAFSNLEIEAQKIRGVVFTSTGPVDVTRSAGEPIWDRRRGAERNPEEASLVL